MKEYSCGFFACVFTEAIMRENGWTGEGGKSAAAGRNSWTSDRLPDAMKEKSGGPDEIENLSAFYLSIHDLVSYIFIWSCI